MLYFPITRNRNPFLNLGFGSLSPKFYLIGSHLGLFAQKTASNILVIPPELFGVLLNIRSGDSNI